MAQNRELRRIADSIISAASPHFQALTLGHFTKNEEMIAKISTGLNCTFLVSIRRLISGGYHPILGLTDRKYIKPQTGSQPPRQLEGVISWFQFATYFVALVS